MLRFVPIPETMSSVLPPLSSFRRCDPAQKLRRLFVSLLGRPIGKFIGMIGSRLDLDDHGIRLAPDAGMPLRDGNLQNWRRSIQSIAALHLAVFIEDQHIDASTLQYEHFPLAGVMMR